MAKFLDLDELSDDERMLKEEVHRFAKEVIRPAPIELDRMPPEERIKPDSPYFEVVKQMKKLGYHKMLLPEDMGGLGLSPLQISIVFEELAWGSLGFATSLGVDMIPFSCAALFGLPELYEEVVVPWLEDDKGKYHGCWCVTEPAHGSDYELFLRDENVDKYGKPDITAEKDGDEWVISGQKSAWVSSAPVATHGGVHVPIKGAKRLSDAIFCIVPLDEKHGVKKGKPSDMLGMRDDPQGELFFDNVRIPEHYVVVAPGPFYGIFCDQLVCMTSCGMGAYGVGLARAAFEEALNYARQRVQGGEPLIKHKNIKLKLYEMFEKIETARYYVRKVSEHVFSRMTRRTNDASPRHAKTAQIYGKRIAFEVAHEALQIFGAYGLSKEFIIEKLFRDARCMIIEDFTIEVLGLEVAADVIDNYEKDYYDVEHINRLYSG